MEFHFTQPEQVLQLLREGNQRFAGGCPVHPRCSAERRTELVMLQRPMAAVVCCSDSRTPPEILFDQGIGDLFVVRTAGNVLDEVGFGSLEYAVQFLEISCIVVLGHTRCGAVMAAASGVLPRGHLARVVHAIHPSLERGRNLPGDAVLNTILENVRMTVDAVRTCPEVLSTAYDAGELTVVGALYHLETGVVEFPESP